MPPRHAYWTIIVDNQPTAFRAHDAEELEATLNRLKEKHPSAVMRWFERGQLWESRDAARAQGFGQGERRWEGPRPDRTPSPDREPAGESRGREKEEAVRDRKWRPGGDHRDPRQKYRDAKKAKWTRFKEKVRGRNQDKRDRGSSEADPRQFTPPHGDPFRDHIEEDRQRKPWRPTGDRAQRPARPRTAGGRQEWRSDDQRDRGRFRPERRDRSPKGEWRAKPTGDWRSKPQGERRSKPKGEWQPKPKGAWRPRPEGERRQKPQGEWQPKPEGDRRPKPRGEWQPKPKGEWRPKPQGERRSKPQGEWRPKPQGERRPKPQGEWQPKPKGEWRARPQGNRRAKPQEDWRAKPHGGGRRSPKPQASERKRRDDE